MPDARRDLGEASQAVSLDQTLSGSDQRNELLKSAGKINSGVSSSVSVPRERLSALVVWKMNVQEQRKRERGIYYHQQHKPTHPKPKNKKQAVAKGKVDRI